MGDSAAAAQKCRNVGQTMHKNQYDHGIGPQPDFKEKWISLMDL